MRGALWEYVEALADAAETTPTAATQANSTTLPIRRKFMTTKVLEPAAVREGEWRHQAAT